MALLGLASALLLGAAAVGLDATAGTPGGELTRATALAEAWARTGSCGAARFAGKCGVAVAVAVTHGAAPPVIVTVAAGGGPSQPSAAFSPETLFEIASNTKVLTAITFHRLVHKGNASLSDTLASFLPTGFPFVRAHTTPHPNLVPRDTPDDRSLAIPEKSRGRDDNDAGDPQPPFRPRAVAE